MRVLRLLAISFVIARTCATKMRKEEDDEEEEGGGAPRNCTALIFGVESPIRLGSKTRYCVGVVGFCASA